MLIQLQQILDLFIEQRQADVIRRVVEPLMDCSPDYLQELIEGVRLAQGKAITHPTIVQGMAASRILDDVVKLIWSIKVVR